jgi:hypothetical protein
MYRYLDKYTQKVFETPSDKGDNASAYDSGDESLAF